MAGANYRIVRLEDGGFVVEIVRPGALPQTADGFATEAEASGWIAQDKRLWGAGERLRKPTGGKWRGY
jgi:hypothetical protein